MSTDPAVLRVECYAGYRGEETPRRFTLGKRTIQVAEILDRWLAPDHRYFKLRADDGGEYVLRHDIDADRWQLVTYAEPTDAPSDAIGSEG